MYDRQWDATELLIEFYYENFHVQIMVYWLIISPILVIIKIFVHVLHYSFFILLILFIKYFKANHRHVILPIYIYIYKCDSEGMHNFLDTTLPLSYLEKINNNSLVSHNTAFIFIFHQVSLKWSFYYWIWIQTRSTHCFWCYILRLS